MLLRSLRFGLGIGSLFDFAGMNSAFNTCYGGGGGDQQSRQPSMAYGGNRAASSSTAAAAAAACCHCKCHCHRASETNGLTAAGGSSSRAMSLEPPPTVTWDLRGGGGESEGGEPSRRVSSEDGGLHEVQLGEEKNIFDCCVIHGKKLFFTL